MRYWLLSQHYRRPLTFEPEQLDQAAKTVERLGDFVERLRFMNPGEPTTDLDQILFEAKGGIQEAMDNDLNVPKAMGHLFAMVRRVNRLMNQGWMDARQVELVLEFVEGANRVLGVVDMEPPAGDAEIESLVHRRDAARADGDFALADKLRDELAAKGVQLIDTPSGTRWNKIG